MLIYINVESDGCQEASRNLTPKRKRRTGNSADYLSGAHKDYVMVRPGWQMINHSWIPITDNYGHSMRGLRKRKGN